MTNIIVDSWMWIEYLNGSAHGARLSEMIASGTPLFTSLISFAEILSLVQRKHMEAAIAENAILSNSQIIPPDIELARQAASIHSSLRKEMKDFGLGDAFIVATARKLHGKILTGDPHFKNIKEALMV